jgi:hypothetical protein
MRINYYIQILFVLVFPFRILLVDYVGIFGAGSVRDRASYFEEPDSFCFFGEPGGVLNARLISSNNVDPPPEAFSSDVLTLIAPLMQMPSRSVLETDEFAGEASTSNESRIAFTMKY